MILLLLPLCEWVLCSVLFFEIYSKTSKIRTLIFRNIRKVEINLGPDEFREFDVSISVYNNMFLVGETFLLSIQN